MVNLSQDSIDEFRVRTALESALIQLDASWLILGDLRLDGPNEAAVADYAVLHPRQGVALIDVVNRRTGEPEHRLRRFLNDRAFGARFPGALPIVRLVVTQCDPATLERQLRAAFGQVAPIGIADPDWVAAINALLAPAAAPTTRPGFPLFRRPAPRRRGPAEQDPAPPTEEPWNVAPEEQGKTSARAGTAKTSPAPPEAPAPRAPEAPAQRPNDGAASAPAADDGAGWRAKPRRQPTASDEPSAGQQIQSLIALLRQNGVQKRMPTRPQSDEQAIPSSAAAAPERPRNAPAQSALNSAAPPSPEPAEPDLFGAMLSDPAPIRPDPQPAARGAATEPEEAEDDILSSAKTTAAAEPAADFEFEEPPTVATPPFPDDEMAAAAEDAPKTRFTFPKFRWPKFAASTSRAESVEEPVESDAEDRDRDDWTETPAAASPAAAYEDDLPPAVAAAASTAVEPEPVVEPNHRAEREEHTAPIIEPEDRFEDARPENAVEETAPPIIDVPAHPADAAPRPVSRPTPMSSPSRAPRPAAVSSAIVVPDVAKAETGDDDETDLADEIRPAAYGDLRVTRADQLSAPHVVSSIVAPAAYRRLRARREDAIAPPPIQRMRWRSGVAAGALLVAVLGGATAWLRPGAVPDWLPITGPLSIVSSLPTPAVNQNAAPAQTASDNKPASVADNKPGDSKLNDSKASDTQPGDNKTASIAPPAPTPAAKPTPPAAPVVAAPAPAPAATQSAPAASSSRSSTMTAAITPPQVEPPAPTAKPAEPPKRPASRRAVPSRAASANPPPPARDTPATTPAPRDAAIAAASRDAAAAALPPIPQGPPIDATELPPIATPAAAPAASIASAESSAARLHAPTSLTPVWTKASTAAPPAAAAAGTPAASANGEACHSYTATRTLLGQPRQVSGLACRDGSGQWQIISELPR
jgi:hypothetical protein